MPQKVSVIMPAYNAEKYIAKSIESLLAQTWQDWELIVVNDGSTDATATVLETFKDLRITIITQHNQGEASARNAGLDRAEGDFISFLDSDDLYLPNALGDHVSFLATHSEFDVSFSDGFYADSQGNYLMRLSEQRTGIHMGNILEPLILDPTVVSFPVCTCMRRLVVVQSGVRFDTNLVIGPDWDFFIHLARYAQFGYLDRLTCVYRIHETNISRTSGYQKRLHDLTQGRLKILYADWFADLSLSTRREFLRYLLVVLFQDNPVKQQQILQSTPVKMLPESEQAYLLRMIATSYLLILAQSDFAVDCLEKALTLSPADCKGRLLLRLAHISPKLSYVLLQIWHNFLKIKNNLLHKRPRNLDPIMANWLSFGK